jgi:hypothetical protein
MTSNQETLAGVAQCTSTGHGDAEAPQTLPMRTLFAASVGNAVEWYDWTVDAPFSIYFATQIFPAENESLAFIGTFATYALAFSLLSPIYTARFKRPAVLLKHPRGWRGMIALFLRLIVPSSRGRWGSRNGHVSSRARL